MKTDLFINLLNNVALCIGWMVLTTTFVAIIVVAYIYVFLTPYCPVCKSRRQPDLLAGNTGGGYRCENCDNMGRYTYYYWDKKGPFGIFSKSYLE